MTDLIQARDERIKKRFSSIFKNKTNLILIGIILIVITICIFFFMQVINAGQVSWWDSSEYMSQGLHYATGIPYEVNPQRPQHFNI